MACSSVCACVGQLFWKLSYSHGLSFLLFGFFLYIVGALIMIYAYRFGPLSTLQPILCLNYIFAIVLGAVILGEAISPGKIIGSLGVCFGVFLVSTGDKA